MLYNNSKVENAITIVHVFAEYAYKGDGDELKANIKIKGVATLEWMHITVKNVASVEVRVVLAGGATFPTRGQEPSVSSKLCILVNVQLH